MVALYVMHGKVHLFCGNFKNENEATRWYCKNKHSFQDNDGYYGEPVIVTSKKRNRK